MRHLCIFALVACGSPTANVVLQGVVDATAPTGVTYEKVSFNLRGFSAKHGTQQLIVGNPMPVELVAGVTGTVAQWPNAVAVTKADKDAKKTADADWGPVSFIIEDIVLSVTRTEDAVAPTGAPITSFTCTTQSAARFTVDENIGATLILTAVAERLANGVTGGAFQLKQQDQGELLCE